MNFDISGLKVMIGMPIMDGRKAWETEKSLLDTRQAIRATGIHFEERFVVGCSVVEQARSKIAHQFLDSECNRLFMIDADMVWRPDDFLRLLALSTKLEVVGCTYPAKKLPAVFMLQYDESELVANEYGCLPIHGMGLGFTVVSREVMERLANRAPDLIFPDSPTPKPHIFRGDAFNGAVRGEDMAFFADIRELGYKVWLDPAVELGHVGTYVYRASFLELMQQQ